MTFHRRNLLGAGLLAAAMMLPGAVAAQDPVSFEGETVEWTIPFGEGGGNDTWARFYAPFLSKHLAGEPTVLVRNAPGGGGLSGANAFAKRAQDDGLAILGVSGSNQFPYLLGDKRVRYDYRDFVPVLATPVGAVVYIPADFGIKDISEIEKLKGKKLVFPNTGPTSLDLVPMIAFDMLGLDVKHVFGMNSRGETRLAFERGEANIDYQTTPSYLANIVPIVEEGRAVPLFSLGTLDDEGNIVRDPTFPDIPTFLEAYEAMYGHAPEPSDEFAAYMALFGAGFPAQKMVLLPKSTDDAIVATYRTAFADAVADPELQAAKAKVLGEYKQATGPAAQKMFGIATTISPSAKAWVQQFLKTNYNIDL